MAILGKFVGAVSCFPFPCDPRLNLVDAVADALLSLPFYPHLAADKEQQAVEHGWAKHYDREQQEPRHGTGGSSPAVNVVVCPLTGVASGCLSRGRSWCPA